MKQVYCFNVVRYANHQHYLTNRQIHRVRSSDYSELLSPAKKYVSLLITYLLQELR